MEKWWIFVDFMTKKFLGVICKIIKKQPDSKLEENVMQFVRFGIVGASNTFLSYFLYVFSLVGIRSLKVSFQWDYICAEVISFVLSVAWSFYWNNRFVFRNGNTSYKYILSALLKTYISYSFSSLFLSSVLLILWVNVFGISEFIAPFLCLIINVPLNFLINKFWVFKNEKVGSKSSEKM